MLKMNRASTVWAAAIALIGALTALQPATGERVAPRKTLPESVQHEIKSVELEIDRIETESLDKSRTTSLDGFQQITLLGKLIFYDAQLSVNRNEACSFCHMPETTSRDRSVVSTRRPYRIPGRFARDSVRAGLKLRRTQVTRRRSITTRNRVISSEASSGTCAPRACAWAVR
jgi:hypothetical protein